MPGYTSMPQGGFSTQPVYPGYNNYEAQDSGGVMNWIKEHLGDALKFGGSVAQGYQQSQQQGVSNANDARKFQYNEAAQLADKLNRAPLADRGQYAAMQIKPPMPFQPRDYTQQSQGGINALRGNPTGGAAEQLAANNMAMTNYRPGAGGYDTSTYKNLLHSLTGQTMPQNTTTTNYAGKQYNPQEWSQYLNEHPEVAKFLGPPQGGTTPQTTTAPAPTGNQSNPYGFSLPEKPALEQVYEAWNKVHPGQQPPPPTSGDLMRFWQEYRQGGG